MSEQPTKKNEPPVTLHGRHGPVEKLNAVGEYLQKLRPEICTMRPLLSRTSRKEMRGNWSTITPPTSEAHGRLTVPVLHHEWPTMKPDSPFGYAGPRRPMKARSVMSYIRMSRPGTALAWARACGAMAGTASAARASVLRSMGPRE